MQLDQVLDALNTDTRANLQKFLIYYGEGLTRKPNAAEDAEQLPEVRGLNAAEALNKTYRIAPPGAARRGDPQPGDHGHRSARLLETDRERRQGHVGAQRARAGARRTDRQLQHVLLVLRRPVGRAARDRRRAAHARSAASAAASPRLDASFPPTRTFAQAILPGVKQTPATVKAALPLIEQTKASLAPTELGGVAKGLAAATPSLAKLTGEQVPALRADRSLQQVPDERHLPGRQHEAPGRQQQLGRRELQGVLVQPRGPVGDRPELRRQRRLHQVPRRQQRARRSSRGRRSCSATGLEGTRLLARSPLTPEGTRPAYPPTSRPTSRSCPATRRSCLNSTGPSPGPRGRDGMMNPPEPPDKPRRRPQRPRADRALPDGVHLGRDDGRHRGGRRRLHPRAREPQAPELGAACWGTTTTR